MLDPEVLKLFELMGSFIGGCIEFLAALGACAAAVFAWISSKQSARAAEESRRFMEKELETNELLLMPRLQLIRAESKFGSEIDNGLYLRNYGVGPAHGLEYQLFFEGVEINRDDLPQRLHERTKQRIGELESLKSLGKINMQDIPFRWSLNFVLLGISPGAEEKVFWVQRRSDVQSNFTPKQMRQIYNLFSDLISAVNVKIKYRTPHEKVLFAKWPRVAFERQGEA